MFASWVASRCFYPPAAPQFTSRELSMDSQQVFQTLKNTLVEQFELDPAKITPEARLQEDLDLDSIDAVDMIIKLQEITGRKVRPEDFKEVRTVGDVQRIIEKLLATQAAPA